jgi:hypothetical protein
MSNYNLDPQLQKRNSCFLIYINLQKRNSCFLIYINLRLHTWKKLLHLPRMENEMDWKCGHKPGKKRSEGINRSEALHVPSKCWLVPNKCWMVYECLDPHIPLCLQVVNNVPPSLYVVNKVKLSIDLQSSMYLSKKCKGGKKIC